MKQTRRQKKYIIFKYDINMLLSFYLICVISMAFNMELKQIFYVIFNCNFNQLEEF